MIIVERLDCFTKSMEAFLKDMKFSYKILELSVDIKGAIVIEGDK